MITQAELRTLHRLVMPFMSDRDGTLEEGRHTG